MRNDHKFFKSIDKEKIEERTNPFTLQDVFSFIDDTNISSLDAHELKSRIVNMLESEKAKVNESKWNVIGNGKCPEIPDGKEFVDVAITTQNLAGERSLEFTEYDEDGFNTINSVVAWKYENMEPYMGPIVPEKDIHKDNPPKEKSFSSEDLQNFANGRLAVRISDFQEYLDFIDTLENSDVKLGNAADWKREGYFYNPSYPFYFIEDIECLNMNANGSMENLYKYYNIVTYKDFKDLKIDAKLEQELTDIKAKDFDEELEM